MKSHSPRSRLANSAAPGEVHLLVESRSTTVQESQSRVAEVHGYQATPCMGSAESLVSSSGVHSYLDAQLGTVGEKCMGVTATPNCVHVGLRSASLQPCSERKMYFTRAQKPRIVVGEVSGEVYE